MGAAWARHAMCELAFSLTNVKAFRVFSSRHDFRLKCAFIIASEMNVDDDGGMLQDYKILESIWFSLVSSD